MAASRAQAKNLEDMQNRRIKSYREDEKLLHAEIASLKHDLAAARSDVDELKNLIVASESREHASTLHLSSLETDAQEIKKLRASITALEVRLQEYRAQEPEMARLRASHAQLDAALAHATMRISSFEAEKDRLAREYKQKISTLEANARNVTPSAGVNSSLQQMFDSALAAQQSKFAQLKKQHSLLQAKMHELEMRNQELEGAVVAPRPGSVLSLTRYADDSALGAHSSQPYRRRMGDFGAEPVPEEPYGVGFNATDPLSPRMAPRRDTSGEMREREVNAAFEEFASEGLADTLRVGRTGTGTEMGGKSEPRQFGRGGAGNVKKNKGTEKKGFRGLKGIGL